MSRNRKSSAILSAAITVESLPVELKAGNRRFMGSVRIFHIKLITLSVHYSFRNTILISLAAIHMRTRVRVV